MNPTIDILKNKKLFIFDMDGTLIDSMPIFSGVVLGFLDKNGNVLLPIPLNLDKICFVDKAEMIDISQIEFDITNSDFIEKVNNLLNSKGISFSEYLDICKEYNCIPVIELKWTNGIYSDNDSYDPITDTFTRGNYSNLDGLIQKVYEHGLENEAYIMTSMMGCLLYVKEKYPNIKLQWLCNARVKEFMEYAGKKGIHLDVEYNAVDEEVIACAKKYNQLVNIWTLDDETLLQKYLDLDVDMITTNWIKPR